jgi:glycine/D-amino acid oxidase-like deaminating enzyme
MLRKTIKILKTSFRSITTDSIKLDVAIIGGGAIGSSIAYHLSKYCGREMKIAVIERDPSYKISSCMLSAGGIRQQFSLEGFVVYFLKI